MKTPVQYGIRMLISALLALAVLAASVPQPAAAATCATYYTVQEGDTTVKIAKSHGVKWREIAIANKIKYPYDDFEVGQQLCIPPKSTSSSNSSSSSNTNENTNTVKAQVSVSISGNRLVITVSKLVKKSVFYVKVREASVGVGGWEKVGTLKAPKTDAKTISLTLPDEFRNDTYLNVCLKDMTTDELICRSAVRLP